MSTGDTATAIRAFKQAVNMSPQKLAAWLETSKSKEVGYKSRKVVNRRAASRSGASWSC